MLVIAELTVGVPDRVAVTVKEGLEVRVQEVVRVAEVLGVLVLDGGVVSVNDELGVRVSVVV